MEQSVDDLFGDFISPTRVFCGGLFTDPADPPSNYFPKEAPKVDEDKVDKTNVTLTRSATSSLDFIAKLSALLSVELDHSHNHNVTVTFGNAKTSKMVDVYAGASDVVFVTAGIPDWIQRQWRENKCVYMITGYIAVAASHIADDAQAASKFNGTITINVGDAFAPGAATAAAAVVKALGIGDPSKLGSVTGEAGGSVDKSGNLKLDVTDPTIIAIKYRKVHYDSKRSHWASHGPLGPIIDHLEAKTIAAGALQAASLRISDKERRALYLPTRGL